MLRTPSWDRLELLAEHYALGPELGRGGFGAVFRGRARGGDPVAIKLISPEVCDQGHLRILREDRSLRQLHHPNLVGYRGMFRTQSQHLALVFDYLDGGDLSQRLEEALTFDEALRILGGIAQGLDALHRGGLVHRDLKPENVMLENSGGIKIIDFGLARPVAPGATLTQTGVLIGTPHYMPPEVLAGREIGPASDRYAFGCLAHLVLSGRLPFSGDLSQILAGHESGVDLRIFRSRWPEVPTERLWKALRPYLDRDPRQRPSGCLDLLEACRKDSKVAGTVQVPTRSDPGPRDAPVDLDSSHETRRVESPELPSAPGFQVPVHDSFRFFLRRMGLGWLALVLVGGMGWWWTQRPPSPASPPPPQGPSSPPKSPAKSWGEKELGRLERSVEKARSSIESLAREGNQEIAFGYFVPGIAEFRRAYRGGLNPEELPSKFKQRLGVVSNKLEGLGVADPFWPYLGLERNRSAGQIPRSLRRRLDPDGWIDGWWERALELALALREDRDQVALALFQAAETGFPEGPSAKFFFQSSYELGRKNIESQLLSVARERHHRPWLADFQRQGARLLWAFFYALERGSEEAPERAGPFLEILLHLQTSEVYPPGGLKNFELRTASIHPYSLRPLAEFPRAGTSNLGLTLLRSLMLSSTYRGNLESPFRIQVQQRAEETEGDPEALPQRILAQTSEEEIHRWVLDPLLDQLPGEAFSKLSLLLQNEVWSVLFNHLDWIEARRGAAEAARVAQVFLENPLGPRKRYKRISGLLFRMRKHGRTFGVAQEQLKDLARVGLEIEEKHRNSSWFSAEAQAQEELRDAIRFFSLQDS